MRQPRLKSIKYSSTLRSENQLKFRRIISNAIYGVEQNENINQALVKIMIIWTKAKNFPTFYNAINGVANDY